MQNIQNRSKLAMARLHRKNKKGETRQAILESPGCVLWSFQTNVVGAFWTSGELTNKCVQGHLGRNTDVSTVSRCYTYMCLLFLVFLVFFSLFLSFVFCIRSKQKYTCLALGFKRQDPIPCAQSGKRTAQSEDRQIRIFVQLPGKGRLAVWVLSARLSIRIRGDLVCCPVRYN